MDLATCHSILQSQQARGQNCVGDLLGEWGHGLVSSKAGEVGDLSPIGALESREIEGHVFSFHGWSAPEGFVPYEPKESFLGSVWCYGVRSALGLPRSGPLGLVNWCGLRRRNDAIELRVPLLSRGCLV